ncbi:thiol-activated cytolysin family protein [Paraclostridium bifermentans]|uniref:thiol-activated cytolysin family protein n=1 Tax=Paraclostridium bifermentans TaxID=1490 RepID=UPI0028106CDE|nr:thiol-activated cytolysin family protein [Paraclostridium bifermentans]GKZ02305.1 hypothetical protein ANS014_07390 [Paraclostridium bifermentans]
MIRHKNIKNIVACFTIVIGIGFNTLTSFAQSSNSEEIDNGIANLSYNKNEVLASNGDSIENVTPREGFKTNNKFIVVERNKKNINNISSRYIYYRLCNRSYISRSSATCR